MSHPFVTDRNGSPLKQGDYVEVVYSRYYNDLIHQAKRIEKLQYVVGWRAHVVVVMRGEEEVLLSPNSVKKLEVQNGLLNTKTMAT